MDLLDILDQKCCALVSGGISKEGILEEIAQLTLLSDKTARLSKDEVFQALCERERQGSTGVGDELAIPHARFEKMDSFLFFIVVAQKGISFNSLDRKKVRLFLVLLGPKQKANEHLQALAGLSRVINQTTLKRDLLATQSQPALAECFARCALRHEEPTLEKKKEMKLLLLILYAEDLLYHILEFFIEEGIEGAAIIDSLGMGQFISSVPLFATFIGFLKERKNQSKTILAMIPKEQEREITEGIERITGDLDEKEGATILIVDLSFHKGSMKMM